MRLSQSVSYAVGILLQVQAAQHAEPITAAKLSEGCDLPHRFLYRVLKKMVDAGLMRGISGPRGGYALARSAKEISLLDVVEAIEGPVQPPQLRPVRSTHKPAVRFVNNTCETACNRFCERLAGINLAKLSRMN